jgi:hypothetical protein
MRAFAVGLAGVLLLTSLSTDAAAQGRPWSDGPVLAVTYNRTKAGMFDKYMTWVATDWKRNMEAQKKAGIIVDYAVYTSTPRDGDDWNVALAVTYKNMAALDNLRDRSEPVATQALSTTPEKLAQASAERDAIRDVIGGRLLRQQILK